MASATLRLCAEASGDNIWRNDLRAAIDALTRVAEPIFTTHPVVEGPPDCVREVGDSGQHLAPNRLSIAQPAFQSLALTPCPLPVDEDPEPFFETQKLRVRSLLLLASAHRGAAVQERQFHIFERGGAGQQIESLKNETKFGIP